MTVRELIGLLQGFNETREVVIQVLEPGKHIVMYPIGSVFSYKDQDDYSDDDYPVTLDCLIEPGWELCDPGGDDHANS